MKRIAFVINSLGTGGAEKTLATIVNHLDPRCYSVDVIMTFCDVEQRVDRNRGNIRTRHIIKSNNKVIKAIGYKILCKLVPQALLYRIYIRTRYDIEVAFLEGLPTKVVAGGRKKGKKIAWVHTDLSIYKDSDYCFSDNQLLCYQRFDKIVFPSEQARSGFLSRFNILEDKCLVISNPIDSYEIKAKAAIQYEMEKDEDSFCFVAVGRLVEPKIFDRIIEAAHILKKDALKFRILICGDGPMRTILQNKIDELELSDSIRLIGNMDNPYMVMKAGDAIVISSDVEGYSLVCCEAFVLGKPVLGTRCGGLVDVTDNGRYALLCEKNSFALAAGMKRFMTDYKIRDFYANKAGERGAYFSLPAVLEKIEQLFNEKSLAGE